MNPVLELNFDAPGLTYPERPGSRHVDTSEAAAEGMEQHAGNLQRLVLEALQREPLTADECANRLGLSVLSIRPRFSELRRLGKIRDTGERRRNASGKSAAVWGVM